MKSLLNFITESINKHNGELSLDEIKYRIYDSKEDIIDELGFDPFDKNFGFGPFDKNFDGDMKSAVKKIESSDSVYIVSDGIRDKKQGYFGFLYNDGSSITFESPSNKLMDGYFYGSTKANGITSEVLRYVCTYFSTIGKPTNKNENLKLDNNGLYASGIQNKKIKMHIFVDPKEFVKFSKQLINSYYDGLK